jgi:hypothetical protein
VGRREGQGMRPARRPAEPARHAGRSGRRLKKEAHCDGRHLHRSRPRRSRPDHLAWRACARPRDRRAVRCSDRPGAARVRAGCRVGRRGQAGLFRLDLAGPHQRPAGRARAGRRDRRPPQGRRPQRLRPPRRRDARAGRGRHRLGGHSRRHLRAGGRSGGRPAAHPPRHGRSVRSRLP